MNSNRSGRSAAQRIESGDAGDRDDGGRKLASSTAGKLVFEGQGEFARDLLRWMFDTGGMADVEVVVDDSCFIHCHAEVLVRVSGYFRTLLRGNLIRVFL